MDKTKVKGDKFYHTYKVYLSSQLEIFDYQVMFAFDWLVSLSKVCLESEIH